MVQICSDTCGMCTACCCRADICEEAADSAFLSKLLKRQGIDADQMDERFGWLDLHGCALEYGRPPVCYAYFCDELIDRLPDDEARRTVQTLGRLMHHIGLNALGEWHLVEIRNEGDLQKVDLGDLSRRLEEAQTAFEVIESFMETGRLNAADRETLSAITTDDP